MKTLTFYVAPGGKGSGTQDAPFPTIVDAQTAVRDALAGGFDGTVTVYIEDGIYRLSQPLVFDHRDSPPGTRQRVRYCAAAGATPILSAGRPIDGFTLVDAANAPAGLPKSAVGKVWVADLPADASAPIKALFDADGLLECAHSPRMQSEPEESEPVAPTVPAGVDPEEFLSNHSVYRDLHFRGTDIRDWSSLEDIELFVTPRNPWTVNYLGVESVDVKRRVARTKLPATYPLTTAYGPQHIKRFYQIVNLIDYLDSPGQWVSDTEAGKLYLWPRAGDGPPTGIVAPMTTELVRFEGDFEAGVWVRGIELSGLTFMHGNRYSWSWGRRSVQHDWEEEDAASALLRLRGAEDICITDCSFLHSGSSGLRLDLHAAKIEVSNCELAYLGGAGISLVGFGPGSRDENHHNTICRNHIHHIGRLWWHAAGIFVAQSGHNSITDNRVHHTPYTAIVVSGPRASVFSKEIPRIREGALTIRWDELSDAPIEQPVLLGFRHARYNDISYNEVHDTMELLGDGNGIYVSGAGVGNRIARNYVHDISGQGTVSAIRLDDEQFHAEVVENIVFRMCAAGILTKNINQIENNFIVDCYGPRGYGYLSARHRGPCFGTGIRRNILLRIGGRSDKEPFWLLGDDIGFLDQVAIDDNILWDADAPETGAAAAAELQNIGKGVRNKVADPCFVDAATGDLRFADPTAARSLGILPIDHWGPRATVGPRRGSDAQKPLGNE